MGAHNKNKYLVDRIGLKPGMTARECKRAMERLAIEVLRHSEDTTRTMHELDLDMLEFFRRGRSAGQSANVVGRSDGVDALTSATQKSVAS